MSFLAARRFYDLPSTFPLSTGVETPTICGKIFIPQCDK